MEKCVKIVLKTLEKGVNTISKTMEFGEIFLKSKKKTVLVQIILYQNKYNIYQK